MLVAGDNQNHRVPLSIQIDVFHIDESAFGLKIPHQSGTVRIGHRCLNWDAISRSPSLSHVVRLNKVEVSTDIALSTGMHIKSGDDPTSTSTTGLVVTSHPG